MNFESADKYKYTAKSRIVGAINDYAQMYDTLYRWDKRTYKECYLGNIELAIQKLEDMGKTGLFLSNEKKQYNRVNKAYIRLMEELEDVLGISHNDLCNPNLDSEEGGEILV